TPDFVTSPLSVCFDSLSFASRRIFLSFTCAPFRRMLVRLRYRERCQTDALGASPKTAWPCDIRLPRRNDRVLASARGPAQSAAHPGDPTQEAVQDRRLHAAARDDHGESGELAEHRGVAPPRA